MQCSPRAMLRKHPGRAGTLAAVAPCPFHPSLSRFRHWFLSRLVGKSANSAPSESTIKETSNIHDFTAGTCSLACAEALQKARLCPDFGWWFITMIMRWRRNFSVLPFSYLVCNFQETLFGDCGRWCLRVFGKKG